MLVWLALICVSTPLKADFTDGVIAQQKIGTEEAIRIWREAGWQNDDFLSQIQLGDIYGDDRGDNKYYDPVEAYVWYFLATKSVQLPEYLGNWRVRRVISNSHFRAQESLASLLLLLNVDEREDARRRIIYILSCRGADGFVRLGFLHSTSESFDEPDYSLNSLPSVVKQGDQNRTSSHSRDDQASLQMQGNYGSGTNNDDVPNESPSTYNRLRDLWRSFFDFQEQASISADSSYNASAREVLGIPSSTAILPNDRDALIYFHIADDLGHPLAKYYLRALSRSVRATPELGSRVVQAAETKARIWYPPFEFYPAGSGSSGIAYTDACTLNITQRRAMGLVLEAVPANDIIHAMSFLGWIGNSKARYYSLKMDDTKEAIRKFQTTLAHNATGTLLPEEIIRLIQIAALRGDAASQNTLGILYAKGIGVQKNFVRAENWFKKAGDQRFGPALYHLGVLYKTGPDGIRQDISKANDYFTASALAGFKPTMNELKELLAQAASDHRGTSSSRMEGFQ